MVGFLLPGMSENQMQNLEAQPKSDLHIEIADLEKRLEEKKRLAEISGVEASPEKEVFKEVVKEHLVEKRAQISAGLPSAQTQAQAQQVASDADKLKAMSEQKQLEELINIATSKGPLEAVHIAENLKNPRLVDDLHDHLVDELYGQLVEDRKLKEL